MANPGYADRTTLNNLTPNLQPGQVAASALRLQAFQYLYDQSDANWSYIANLVANGTVSAYLINFIINGSFAVNQRAKSGTVTLTSGQYGHDRWKAGAGGCTYTFVTVNNITTITITAGSLVHVIEGLNLFSGTYTLSWTGTAQGKIGAGAYGASGVTATVVGGTNLSIEFNAGTLSKAQLNAGDVALTFQPRSFAVELALCQRYYEKSYNYDVSPGANSNLGEVIGQSSTSVASSTSGLIITPCHATFKVQKRTIPTVTLYAIGGTINAITIGGSIVRSGATATGPSHNTPLRYVSVDASSAQGITDRNQTEYQWTADAEL